MLKDGEKGVIIQRDKQTYAVAPHIPCGVVTPATLRKIADVAEKFKVPVLKVTSAQRIAMVGIREEDVDPIWQELGMAPGAAVGLCIRSIKACPGTTFCKRGIHDSLSLGMKLDETYHGKELPGKLKLGVSGCPNQCSETCIKDIGFIGLPKGWRVVVGGNGGSNPRLAVELIRDLTDDQAMELTRRLVEHFAANAKPHQRIGHLIDRMGLEAYRAAVLEGFQGGTVVAPAAPKA